MTKRQVEQDNLGGMNADFGKSARQSGTYSFEGIYGGVVQSHGISALSMDEI